MDWINAWMNEWTKAHQSVKTKVECEHTQNRQTNKHTLAWHNQAAEQHSAAHNWMNRVIKREETHRIPMPMLIR